MFYFIKILILHYSYRRLQKKEVNYLEVILYYR